MADRYRNFVNSPPGGMLARQLGLPHPVPLRRFTPEEHSMPGPVLVGGVNGAGNVRAWTNSAVEAEVTEDIEAHERFTAAVFDVTGLSHPGELSRLRDFFRPAIRKLGRCGRVLVVGRDPRDCDDIATAAAHAGLSGFIRSTGKELRAGGTANLLYLNGASTAPPQGLEAALGFFLTGRSAFVSGQVVAVESTAATAIGDPSVPLRGKRAVVTGAARGIGAITCQVLAREGAEVIGVDIPDAAERLDTLMASLDGAALPLDLTADTAPETFAAGVGEGVDIVVHNAGITRDKTLAGMDESQWSSVIDTNLDAPLRITDRLIKESLLRDNGRIIVMSSAMGIAGNRGQTNYTTAKSGLIGLVQAIAPRLRDRGITANAVAPGFIETQMTSQMPLFTREAGRRLSSLAQGGKPIDVAETIAWLAHPGSAGISAQVVRVCGQSYLGA